MHKSENHYQAPIVQNNKKNRHESGPKNTIENQWFIRASNINETQIVGAIINRPSACTQRIIN